MVTSFLIASLVLLVVNAILNLIVVAFNITDRRPISPITVGSLIIGLAMITWNILALISL